MAQLVYATTPSSGCPGQRAIAIALVEPIDATQVTRIDQETACAKIMRMSDSTTVARLVGVFNADGTALGELSYFLRARIGQAHCGLCDVTHGRIRERADWRSCRERIPVPFATYHRDDQPDRVRAASGGRAPIVAAEIAGGEVIVLLGPDELDRCGGSPGRLLSAVEHALADAGLSWASP